QCAPLRHSCPLSLCFSSPSFRVRARACEDQLDGKHWNFLSIHFLKASTSPIMQSDGLLLKLRVGCSNAPPQVEAPHRPSHQVDLVRWQEQRVTVSAEVVQLLASIFALRIPQGMKVRIHNLGPCVLECLSAFARL